MDLGNRIATLRKDKNMTQEQLAVMLNASAACPSGMLDAIMTAAMKQISQEFNLILMIFKKECFGMGG